jgi:hypothetical protein
LGAVSRGQRRQFRIRPRWSDFQCRAGYLHHGVSVGNTLPWGGATTASKPFSNSEFAVDSDVAYQTAEALAADWLKKNPKEKATFQLGSASRFPAPVWYVMWGSKKNGYAALIDTVSGKPVK